MLLKVVSFKFSLKSPSPLEAIYSSSELTLKYNFEIFDYARVCLLFSSYLKFLTKELKLFSYTFNPSSLSPTHK